jgi:hypothetical protein
MRVIPGARIVAAVSSDFTDSNACFAGAWVIRVGRFVEATPKAVFEEAAVPRRGNCEAL